MELGISGGFSTPPANFNTPSAARESEAAGQVQSRREEQTESVATQQTENGGAPVEASARPPVQAAAGPGKGTQLDVSV
ncbi:MAG: hypothetical protein A2516_01005 [Alphaproteobacteria bacterium RIFOXYD12_FULL_60_8]|nr:MAG: hypothetical protein A2516_01005 [Alphaproteobacteria bacterium RIFOXYD12_FULL_60_8]